MINPLDWEFTFDTGHKAIVAPQFLVAELAVLAMAVEKVSNIAAPGYLRPLLDSANHSDRHNALASRLIEAENGVVILGQFAMSHPQASRLRALARYIASATGSAFNILAPGANSAGAWLAGAVPHKGPGGADCETGMNAAQMLADPRRSYVLWGVEPDFDIDNPAAAMNALRQADKVIAVATHASASLREVADVILPLAPLAESEGSLVNFDGDFMSFNAAGRIMGEARPGWKTLRLIGSNLGLGGFGQFNVEEILSELSATIGHSEGTLQEPELISKDCTDGLYRIGELPMYSIDALCRRSAPLQETAQAQNLFLGLNPDDAARLGMGDGARARVRQGDGQAEFDVKISNRVPPGGVWLRSATGATQELGSAIGPVIVEVA